MYVYVCVRLSVCVCHDAVCVSVYLVLLPLLLLVFLLLRILHLLDLQLILIPIWLEYRSHEIAHTRAYHPYRPWSHRIWAAAHDHPP